MKIFDCTQGTEEWMKIRCGIPTASNFDMIITTDGKPSKQRQKYLYRLAGECITRTSEETYQNGNMQRGKELEAEAREFYEMLNNVNVKQVGFCINEKPEYGTSPDGFVGKSGLLEIKCPIMTTHVYYLAENMTQAPQYRLPSDYFQQLQGQLLVTGRAWCDFMSYYPGLKPLIIRVEPHKAFQKALRIELEVFCVELKEVITKIR